MQLEDYFEIDRVQDLESIRIKGTRVGIDVVLDRYLEGESPARIYQNYYHALTLEQVYATLTYYLHNQTEIDAYLERGRARAEAHYQEYLKQDRPEVVKRLLSLRDQRKASGVSRG